MTYENLLLVLSANHRSLFIGHRSFSIVTVCNEIVREYTFTRVKILNLLKAWLKFEDRDKRITEARAPQAEEYRTTIRNQAAQMKAQQAEIEKLKAELARSPSPGGPRHGG